MVSPTTQNIRDARTRIVQEHLDAENKHDLDAIMATFSAKPGFALNGLELAGAEVIRSVYSGFGFGQQGSFSDIQLEIKQWYFGDESVTTEMLLRANHTGEWQGIPATGRRVEVPLCAIFTFDAGNKVASERAYFDAATVLQQIGVLQWREGATRSECCGGSLAFQRDEQRQTRILEAAQWFSCLLQ